MRARHLCCTLVLGLVAACMIPSGEEDSTGDGSSGNGSGTGNGSGGGTTGGDTGLATNTAPQLQSLTAYAMGQWGDTLRLVVQGADANGNVSGIWIHVRDAQNATLSLFDSDQDGEPDTGERQIGFDEDVLGRASFEAEATLSNLAAMPAAASVEVALIDAYGLQSAKQTVAIAQPAVQEEDQTCDPGYVDSRCDDALACRGQPPTCHPGEAPVLDRVAYLQDATGSRILAQGTDPDSDVTELTLEFLDTLGNPVAIDLDNDEVPESTRFDVDVRARDQGGTFFLQLDNTEGFSTVVDMVAVTPKDSKDHVGNRLTASLAAPELRSAGQYCDLRGFDRCLEGTVCTQLGVATTCQPMNSTRLRACGTSPIFVATSTRKTFYVRRRIEGASLWDAPEGCAANDPVGYPETVVRLRLTASSNRVTLTTVRPSTNLDTILYVLPQCGASHEALACNDDAPQSLGSTLVLPHLAAGEYLVVVDSWSREAGDIELFIEVS